MDEYRERTPVEEWERDVEAEARRAGIRKLIATAGAVLAAAVVLLAVLTVQLLRDKRALEETQAETLAQLELQRDVAEALQAQQEEREREESLIKDAAPVITRDQLTERLSSIRELVTRQYVYTNAARREQNQTWFFGWERPFSEKSLLATYDGVIKAGIDLGGVTIDVDEASRTITVTLPPSTITDNNIPQETINVLEVKNGLFNEVTIDDYNALIVEEKRVMEEKAVEMLMDAVKAIRTRRAEMNVPPSKKAEVLLVTAAPEPYEQGLHFLQRLAFASQVRFAAEAPADLTGQVSIVTHNATAYLPLSELVDLAAERERIAKEKAKAEGHLKGIEAKLNNEAFTSKAPEHIVQNQREQAEKLRALIAQLEQSEAAMRG